MGKRNKRGMGAVRWREDIKKYVIDFYDNLGKRHVETIGTNKHAAEDKLLEKMNQVRKGTYVPQSQGTTFKEFAEGWFKGKVGVKEATRVSYQGILNKHLIPYFGEGRISDMRRENIRQFVKGLDEEGNLNLR